MADKNIANETEKDLSESVPKKTPAAKKTAAKPKSEDATGKSAAEGKPAAKKPAAKKPATTKPASKPKAEPAAEKPAAASKPEAPDAPSKPAAASKSAASDKSAPKVSAKSTGKLKITLVKSLTGRHDKHIATAKSLGLKKIGATTLQPDNPQTRGKIAQIKYLITVTEDK